MCSRNNGSSLVVAVNQAAIVYHCAACEKPPKLEGKIQLLLLDALSSATQWK
jgi:hypothetical protein